MTQNPPTQPTGQNASPVAGILKDVAAATHAVRTKLGELTHDNRGRIDSAVQKATDFVNRQTKGQYGSTVDKVATMVRKGVDQVENQRTATPPSGAPTSTSQAGTGVSQPGTTVLRPSTPTPAPAEGGPSAGPAPQPTAPPADSQSQAGWRRDASGNWVREDPPVA